MIVPFFKPSIGEEEISGVVESLKQGWLTMGQKTFQFEQNFCKYVGAKYGIAVNSCTAGLHLGLRVIGIKPGDEVIVPTTTFVATAEVVTYFGAKPVLVDVERETHLLNPTLLERVITDRTKGIIPVHFAGQPTDMEQILQIAHHYNLKVIEDAAHALPATYRGKRVGTIGDLTAFSFYATKTITTGEGGMITTNREDWAEQLKILRLHGISKDAWKRYSKEGSWKYDVISNGYKYNTTDLNSSLGIAQLKKANQFWRARKRIVEKYNSAFKGREELILYKIKPDRESAYHLYPLKLNLDALKIDRDRFIEELKQRGVYASVHFIPIYRFSYYRERYGYRPEKYPVSEWIFNRVLSLPLYPSMELYEVEYVIDKVLDIIKKYRR